MFDFMIWNMNWLGCVCIWAEVLYVAYYGINWIDGTVIISLYVLLTSTCFLISYDLCCSVDLKGLVEQNKPNFIPPASRMTNYVVLRFGNLKTELNVGFRWFHLISYSLVLHCWILIVSVSILQYVLTDNCQSSEPGGCAENQRNCWFFLGKGNEFFVILLYDFSIQTTELASYTRFLRRKLR